MPNVKKEYRYLGNIDSKNSRGIGFLVPKKSPITSSDVRYIIANIDYLLKKRDAYTDEKDLEIYDKLIMLIRDLEKYYYDRMKKDKLEAERTING